MELITRVDEPPKVNSGAAATGEGVLVESLIGQINGRPVFASEILDPLDGRLRQIGAQARDEQTWLREAGRAIVQQLRTRIEDELVLAEARRNLTPEQKQGLLSILAQVEQNLVSSQRGSAVAADEALREQTGRGLRQEAQDQLDRQLIVKELRDKVGARIVVSWSDIKNEYERSYGKFNPPSTALFRMITIDPKKPEDAARVGAELASGKSFAEVAAGEINTFNRLEKGKMDRKFTGALSEGEYSPFPEINSALRGLSVGQVAGPIAYNPRPPEKDKPAPEVDPSAMRTAFVYLERIDTPQGVSLYDAQLGIEQELRSQRQGEEIQRYMDRLRKRGNISRIEIMATRLMMIATDRYAPKFKKG